MAKAYIQPDVNFIRVNTVDILIASDEEVFVDGGGLFDFEF